MGEITQNFDWKPHEKRLGDHDWKDTEEAEAM
jgi:hypothetical protein